MPLELSAGLKYQWGPLEVRGAFGGGLIDGVGAPQQRATIGVSYRFGTDFPERRPFRPASILALSATPPTADEARRQTQEQDQKRRRRCPPGEMVPGCPSPSAPKGPPRRRPTRCTLTTTSTPRSSPPSALMSPPSRSLRSFVFTRGSSPCSSTSTAPSFRRPPRDPSPRARGLGGPPQSTRVEAHASRTGSTDHNAMLAAARAMSATAALTSMVPPETLSSSSFGATDPLVPVVEDEAASRRVRVVLSRTLPATTHPAADDEVKR